MTADEPGGARRVRLRPEWDEYFMSLAELAATRSTCLRRQVGALLVSGSRVLSTGYNGAPKGLAHCLELGCLRTKAGIPSGQRQEMCRAIHAEQNAIIQSARYGVTVTRATLYCTHQPCATCLKMLLNLDVTRFVFRRPYPDELSLALMRESGLVPTQRDDLTIWSLR